MKSNPCCLLLFLATAAPALAWPYALKSGIIGVDQAVTTGTGGARFDQPPTAVNFAGNGRLQWYAGGQLMTNAPFPGSLTLPGILLLQTPGATVKEMASAVCDVDSDGDLDVVRVNEWVGNANIYTFHVFLNSGAGTFTAGWRYDWVDNPGWSEGQHFLQLCAGDFNSDGTQDVAVLETYNNRNSTPNPDRDEGRLFIRWNNGAGDFTNTSTVKSTGLAKEARVSAADCDRDGDLDLACTRDTVWPADGAEPYFGVFHSRLYRNNGSGTFSQSDLSARPAAFADVNRDGWVDLVSSTDVALNDGTGSFATQVTEVAGAVAAWTHADADGDGISDLIRAEGVSLVHYKGVGNGAFAASWSRLVTLPAEATALGSGDSDGDGDLDFFVTLTDGSFALVENRRLHTVPGTTVGSIAAAPGITALHCADFNLDGIPDVAGLAPSSKSIWIIPGKANGTFDTPQAKLTGGQTPHSMAVADFDRDGRPDIAYSRPAAGDVRLARNVSDSPAAWVDSAMLTGMAGVSQLVTGQLGSVGKFPDLLTSNATNGQLRWIYWNNTDWYYQTAYTASPPSGAILAAPITSAGTGHEIVYLHSSASTRTIGARQMNPTWSALGSTYGFPVTNGPHAEKMVWGDTNADGKGEAVFISGDGSLATWQPLTGVITGLPATDGAIRDIAVADWDRNGRADILCATSTGLELVYWSQVALSWETVVLANPAGGCQAVQSCDSNRDGWPDAVVSDGTQVRSFPNSPRLLRTGYTPSAIGIQLTGGVNQTETLQTMAAATAGRAGSASVSADVDALITGAAFRFARPPAAGSGDLYGPDLTGSDLASLVTAIRFKADGVTIGSVGPAAMASGGRLDIPWHTVLGNLVRVNPGVLVTLTVEVVFRPDAHESAIKDFYIIPQGLWSVPDDDLTPVTPGAGVPGNLSTSRATLVTLSPPRTPLDNWREWYFGAWDASTGTAANNADPDGDGVPNLVEFIHGTNPLLHDAAGNAQRGLTLLPLPNLQTPVKLRFSTDDAAWPEARVRISLQQGTTTGSWSTLATRAGGAWSGLVPMSVSQPEGRTDHLFNLPQTPASAPRSFFRLKVEELP